MNYKGYKHLTYSDRIIISRMLDKKFSKQQIADAIGCSLRTVYYEIKRCTYEYLDSEWVLENKYNPDGAHQRYRSYLKEKGKPPKLSAASKTKDYIETMIADYKYSPEAVLLEINMSNISLDVEVKSVHTIYAAIEKGYFESLSLKSLPRKKEKRKKKIERNKHLRSFGGTIESRSDEINSRKSFGHWEMDTVHGQRSNKKTLLVLTERKTRYEIIEPLKSCTVNEVVKALNRLEKSFGSNFYKIFKTITCDNGVEFKNPDRLSKALYRKGKRTKIYYCHPYSAFERGSNENNNLLVRRFLEKGANFDVLVNKKTVKEIEEWMNFYPRKLFDGDCAYNRYSFEINALTV